MVLGKIVPVAFVAALTLSAGGLAVVHAAEGVEANDAAMLASTKISLADAVGIAERQSGGKAMDAGLVSEAGKPSYEIRLVKGGATQDLLVDAETGAVVADLTPDAAEQEGAADEGGSADQGEEEAD